MSHLAGRRSRDPYWDAFIHRPLSDPANDLTPAVREAPEGSVYPVKTEVRDPAIMSRDIKELATFFGASLAGITTLDPSYLKDAAQSGDPAKSFPFAIVCVVHADYDPRLAQGLGGRLAAQESAIINFNLSAYIRELGYHATIRAAGSSAAAVAAGLGKLDKAGCLVAKGYGTRVYVGDLILTDLPLAPDGPQP